MIIIIKIESQGMRQVKISNQRKLFRELILIPLSRRDAPSSCPRSWLKCKTAATTYLLTMETSRGFKCRRLLTGKADAVLLLRSQLTHVVALETVKQNCFLSARREKKNKNKPWLSNGVRASVELGRKTDIFPFYYCFSCFCFLQCM